MERLRAFSDAAKESFANNAPIVKDKMSSAATATRERATSLKEYVTSDEMKQRVTDAKTSAMATAGKAKNSVVETASSVKDTVSDKEKMASKGNAMKEGVSTITSETINAPVSMTMESQIEKSINIMQDFMRAPDRAIPQTVLEECCGLCFLTVVRAGFVFTGKLGTGLVVAKKLDGSGWTGPCAVASTGVGWGAQIGGEVTDYIIVIRTPAALAAFSGPGSISFGAGVSIAAGPVGRTAEVEGRAGGDPRDKESLGVAACYSYSRSRGLFAGISLEGNVLVVRPDLNEKFYGEKVSGKSILTADVAAPVSAEGLNIVLSRLLTQSPETGLLEADAAAAGYSVPTEPGLGSFDSVAVTPAKVESVEVATGAEEHDAQI